MLHRTACADAVQAAGAVQACHLTRKPARARVSIPRCRRMKSCKAHTHYFSVQACTRFGRAGKCGNSLLLYARLTRLVEANAHSPRLPSTTMSPAASRGGGSGNRACFTSCIHVYCHQRKNRCKTGPRGWLKPLLLRVARHPPAAGRMTSQNSLPKPALGKQPPALTLQDTRQGSTAWRVLYCGLVAACRSCSTVPGSSPEPGTQIDVRRLQPACSLSSLAQDAVWAGGQLRVAVRKGDGCVQHLRRAQAPAVVLAAAVSQLCPPCSKLVRPCRLCAPPPTASRRCASLQT